MPTTLEPPTRLVRPSPIFGSITGEVDESSSHTRQATPRRPTFQASTGEIDESMSHTRYPSRLDQPSLELSSRQFSLGVFLRLLVLAGRDSVTTPYFTLAPNLVGQDQANASVPDDVGEVTTHLSTATADMTSSSSTQELARTIRIASGLEVGHLAKLFGVERATYHNWLRGIGPNGKHRDHLLAVAPLIQAAAAKFRASAAVATWLLTPIEPAGPRPIDLLSAQDYQAFQQTLARVVQRAPLGTRSVSSRFTGQRDLGHIQERLATVSPTATLFADRSVPEGQ